MYQQITLIGNLGADPEMRYTATGTPVTTFRMAVSKQWTGADGQKQEKTTWFRVSAWKKQAELVSQYLTKGRQVMVIGEMEEPSTYINKAGEQAASLEVTAREIKFLGGRPGDAEQGAPAAQRQSAQAGKAQTRDEDIPF